MRLIEDVPYNKKRIQSAFEQGFSDEEITSALIRGLKRNIEIHERYYEEEGKSDDLKRHYEESYKRDKKLLSVIENKNMIFYIDELSQFDWFFDSFNQKK